MKDFVNKLPQLNELKTQLSIRYFELYLKHIRYNNCWNNKQKVSKYRVSRYVGNWER